MALTDLILLRIAGDSSGGERALDRMNTRLRAFGAALSAVSAIGANYIKNAAQTAARTEVLGTAMMVVAKRAGYGEAQISALEQRLKELGITTQQARLNITRFIQAGLDLSRIEEIADAARNLAVIAGTNTSEAFETLTQAIATTNPRLLRQLNLLVSLNEVYGKNAASMSTAEKRQRLMNWIIAEGAKVSGVYKTAMGDVGKAVTSLPRLFEEVRNAVGKHFLPVWKVLVDLLSAALKWFEALPEPMQKMVAWGLALVTAVAGITGPLLVIISFWPKIVAGFTAAAAVLPIVIKLVLGVSAVLAALIGAIKIAKKAWDENWGGIRDTVQFVIDTIKPHLDRIAADVHYWVGEIKKQLAGIMDAIRAIVEPALRRLRELFGDGFGIAQAMQFIRDGVNVILSLINSLLKTIRLLLEGKSDEAWKPLEDAALNVITLVVMGWRKFISKALTHGWNLVVQFANGIIRAANTVLRAAANYIGQILSRFLAPGSPPKEGPLRGIVRWGKGLIDTYLRSFALADFGILRDVLSPLRDALQSAVDLGDVSQTDMLSVFRTVRAEVAGLIAEFRQTGQINEEVMAGIAQRLGEGGREYMEYLRLTLEHQRAMQKVKDIEAEVAEAQKRGFVPAELEQRLKAAQEEAKAAEDAANWQREYLDALQEGADLQREMVEAMKELAEAIKGVAGADAGAGVEGALPIPEVGEAVGVEFAGFGGFSEEFNRIKEEVRAWFESLPGKIDVWWENIKATVAQKWLEIRVNILAWLLQVQTAIRESPIFGPIVTFIEETLLPAIDEMKNRIGLAWLAIKIVYNFLLKPVFDALKKFLDESLIPLWDEWVELVRRIAGLFAGLLLTALRDKLLIELGKLFDLIQLIKGAEGFEGLDEFLTGTFFVTLGILKTQYIDPLVSAIDSISTAVDSWRGVLDQLNTLLNRVDLPDWMKPGSPTPLETGIRGITDALSNLLKQWNDLGGKLALSASIAAPRGFAGAAAGFGTNMTLYFGEGAFYGAFPGVRDGRDAWAVADAVKEQLQVMVKTGQLKSLIPGGR